jgi:WD40 repeat protein
MRRGRSPDGRLLASGDTSGTLRVARFPCGSTADLLDSSYLHVGVVSSVTFLPAAALPLEIAPAGTHLLVSAGARDNCLLQYRVEPLLSDMRKKRLHGDGHESEAKEALPEEELPDVLKRIIAHAKTNRLSGIAQGTQRDDDGESEDVTEELAPFAASICAPTGAGNTEVDMTPPDWELHLEHIHGCESHRCKACARVLASGNVVYAAAHLVIVLRHDVGAVPARSQRILREHTARVQAIAVHPDGVTVASAQEGMPGTVLVWNTDTMQVICRAFSLSALFLFSEKTFM